MCEIITEDDKVFPLYALVDGHIIEINEAVEKDPNIILESVNFFPLFQHEVLFLLFSNP